MVFTGYVFITILYVEVKKKQFFSSIAITVTKMSKNVLTKYSIKFYLHKFKV